MWQPIKINLKRFISHEESEYIFKNGVAEIISGINLDDDGQESNGSGKSAIIEAIIFALTGDSFRKVKAIDLIMNDEDSADISMELINNVIGKKLVIVRKLERKKSSTVKVFINDIEKTDLPTVNDYNKFIIDLIGISRDDLMNYFVVSKDRYVSFFNSSDTKKKEIISRFSGANLIDTVDTYIDTDVKDIDKKMSEVNNNISKLDGQIEVYEEQLLNVVSVDDQKRENDEKIAELKSSKKIIERDIKQTIGDIDNLQKNKLKAEGELSKIDYSKFEKELLKINGDEKALKETLLEIKSTVGEYDEVLADINKSLLDVIECPKCHHNFSVKNEQLDIEEIKGKVPLLENERKEYVLEYNTKKTDLPKFDILRTQVKAEIDKIKDIKSEYEFSIKQIDRGIKDKKDAQKTFELQIDRINKNILEYQNIVFSDKSGALRGKLEELAGQKSGLDKTYDEYVLQKEETLKWVFNFKKFKTYLANKSIKSIESYTNYFLGKIRTNLNIRIEGYKLLSNNTLKESITIDVLRNGMMEGLFEKFSGGERMRIDISTILALQKLINLSSNSGGLDLLLLDEIIESVDAAGVSEIMKQLNTIGQTIAVITHANQVREFTNQTVVVKQNKISKIQS